MNIGEEYEDTKVQCQTKGKRGNGYVEGQIDSIIDPFAYSLSCENLTESDGGADAATDEEFYELLRLSMDGYSCAGARGGYIYFAKQVGVYAALDVDKEKASDPETRAKMKLLFIMQDEKGVTIPSAMEASFLLELYCMIGITNNGRFEVSISAAGIVTAAYLREALERTIAAHNADPGAHNSLAARMLAIETALNGSGTIIQAGDPTVETVGQKGQHYINPETGAEFECVEVNEDGYIWNPVEDGKSVRDLLGALGNAETTLADVDARLGLLELMYRTQVNGNPFTVSFSDMSGLVVTGVWNETLKRVEF